MIYARMLMVRQQPLLMGVQSYKEIIVDKFIIIVVIKSINNMVDIDKVVVHLLHAIKL